MEGFDIVTTLTTFAGDITSDVTAAAPIIAGVVVAFAGVTVGIKYLKKLIAKL